MKALSFALLAVVAGSSLKAQTPAEIPRDDSAASPSAPFRDPHRAKVLGMIFPGAGHIYAGEYLRGYATYLATVSGFSLGPIIYSLDPCSAVLTGCEKRISSAHVLGIVMVVEAALSWISSAHDAPRAAERANLRHELRASRVKTILTIPAEAGTLNAGVSLQW